MTRALWFVSLQDVLDIHADTIRHEGGHHGIRDIGLLETAVTMPSQSFGGQHLHSDLAEMAAAYLFHLSQNHPFVDGNKRVALSTSLVFLMANGFELDTLPDPDDAERITLRVASGEMSKQELAAWFRAATPQP